MVKVKNVRAGMLLITDAGLQLAPGAVAEVAGVTPQLERAVAIGHLVLVQEEVAPVAKAAVEDLSALPAPDAVARVQAETDAAQLQAWLAGEKRRSVIAAINARVQELGPNTG